MYRRAGANLEVLLVHPGGPYWRKKDEGAWSIPKGEMDEGEEAEVAARREFTEETGVALSGTLEPLGEIRQRGGKRVIAFAIEKSCDCGGLRDTSWTTSRTTFAALTAAHGGLNRSTQHFILKERWSVV
jgi:predicted NUDIX family NTP pyrophosphohydrolase